jgi:biopolymer transport protein ExbD
MKHLLEECLVAFALTTAIAPFAVAQSPQEQPMRKGISVRLAATSNAAPVPDADRDDSLIVTVTAAGSLYSGINPTTPSALPGEIRRGIANRKNQTLYIKVDARAPYDKVVGVLDAARTAGVKALVLLTAQPNPSNPGSPEGLELSLGPSS